MTKEILLQAEPLIQELRQFAAQRNWEGFHTPRNLVLALTGEVGELAEIFQWMTDEEVALIHQDSARFEHVHEEIADVLLYLVRLASVMNIDLNHAVTDKLIKNAIKYPVPSVDETLNHAGKK
jgi:NTP pyrophosphatase (non-canonical NTP hydrolase)